MTEPAFRISAFADSLYTGDEGATEQAYAAYVVMQMSIGHTINGIKGQSWKAGGLAERAEQVSGTLHHLLPIFILSKKIFLSRDRLPALNAEKRSAGKAQKSGLCTNI